jgi:hypothetical protein
VYQEADAAREDVLATMNSENRMPTTPTNVSVADFNASGITVVPYSSTEFASLVKAFVPAVAAVIEPLLPYSILIRNGSTKPVIAYAVSWTTVDAEDAQDTDTYVLVNLVSLVPVISPGAVSLAPVLGQVAYPGVVGNLAVRAKIAESAQTLRSKASVAVFLDTVLFDDGTNIGSDTADSLALLRTHLKAEYDLYTAVVKKSDTGTPDSGLESWLKKLVPPASWPPPLNGTDSCARQYQFRQWRFASNLIEMASHRGWSGTVAYIRSMLQSKPYPRLIVN